MSFKNISLTAVVVISFTAMLGCKTPNSPRVRFPVIYLDMDGTTLGSDHKIRPATLSALRQYRACGGHFGIATGRTVEQVAPYLDTLQPDFPIVLFNGAVVMSSDGRTTLASTPISREALRRAVEAVKGQPGVVGIIVQGPALTMTDSDNERLRNALSSSFISDLRVDPDLRLGESEVAIKVLVFVEPTTQEELVQRLRTSIGDSARVIVTSPEAVEVVAPGVNKARSISEQLSERGYTLDDTMTFGDSGNDVEMLSEAALGVAMKNCREEACRAALVITDDHDTDAIASVIEHAVITRECRADQKR